MEVKDIIAMTKEDKDSLYRYLCMALPYGVKCRQFKLDSQICTLTADLLNSVNNLEPYLRPLSSITDEEMDAYTNTGVFLHANGIPYNLFYTTEGLIFLLNNHFDIFDLIPQSLAIEVTEENNPYNITEEQI